MYKEKTCPICNKLTTNKKFCSRSCSATNSNLVSPRKGPPRKYPDKKCRLCDTLVRWSCLHCAEHARSLGDMTLQDAIYVKHHRSSAFALVRARARSIMKDGSVCQNCGYDKHVEVCHIKPISSYSLDTLISVINTPSNLKILCPNCHWEFDHSL